jgi:ribosome maturation factor RimP
MSKSVSETISRIIEPSIDNMGLELVEVEFKKEQGQWILRVYIDREGGVRLQDCEKVSREIEPLLDVEDPVIHSFTLEVSSPGLQRPLKRISDFQRFQGKLAKIKLYTPIESEKKFCAHILRVEGDQIILDREGKILQVPFANIAKANLEIEW